MRDLAKLTPEENIRYVTMIKSEEKVKVIVTDILAECQRQDFTVKEFEMLVQKLDIKRQFAEQTAKEETMLYI